MRRMTSVVVRYFATITKTMKLMRMVSNMFRTIAIFVLLTYSVYITIKYVDTYYDKEYYRKKLEEFNRPIEFYRDTIVRIVEKEIPREVSKVVYVPKIQRDTIRIFEMFPVRLEDTFYTTFSWSWFSFLNLRDTIKLIQDTLYRVKIVRVWNVEKPLVFRFHIYEKSPERFWINGFINIPEFVNYVGVDAMHSISSFRWYLGLGMDYFYGKSWNLNLQNSVVYDRFKLDLRVSQKYLGINLNYRVR